MEMCTHYAAGKEPRTLRFRVHTTQRGKNHGLSVSVSWERHHTAQRSTTARFVVKKQALALRRSKNSPGIILTSKNKHRHDEFSVVGRFHLSYCTDFRRIIRGCCGVLSASPSENAVTRAGQQQHWTGVSGNVRKRDSHHNH